MSRLTNPSKKLLDQGAGYYQSLINFSRDYPKSIYADDAEFIDLMTKSATFQAGNINIGEWKDFAVKHPTGKVEDLTLRYLSRINAVSFEYYLPYSAMPLEAMIMKAFFEKRYADEIKFTRELLNTIELRSNVKLKNANAAPLIYVRLLNAYKMLGKKEEFDQAYKEAVSIFPEKASIFKDIW